MSRGSWRLYAAVGAGFAGFIAILWAAYALLLTPYQNSQERERTHSARSYDKETVEYAEWRCRAEPEAFRDICVDKETEAQRSERRAAYDLKAQQEMAAWAFGVLIVSVFGLFISAGGLGALIWTFHEQRKMFRADAQAYIEVVWLDIDHDPTYGLTLVIYVANRGKTPAKKLMFSGDLNVVRGEEFEYPVYAYLGILPANSTGVMIGRNYDVLEDFRFLRDYETSGSHGRKTWSVMTEDPSRADPMVQLTGELSWDDSFNPVQRTNFGDIAFLRRDDRPLWLGNRTRRGNPNKNQDQ